MSPPTTLPTPDWNHLFYPETNYNYFRNPGKYAFRPNLGRLDFVNASWMADASMLAYGRSGPDLIPRLDFAAILDRAGFDHHGLIGIWTGGAKGTQAFFAYNSQFAVLSFRGTEKDDWRDLLADLCAWPVEADQPTPTGGEPQKTMFHFPLRNPLFNPAACGVHFGFQEALEEVWGEVEHWLDGYRQSYPNAEVCFTGHSLGAALATLAISRFTGGKASLYTFGSPRAGNQVFCDRVPSHATLGQYRFVNHEDLVTHLPPKSMFYAHTGGLQYIDSSGQINVTPEPESVELEEIAKALSTAARAVADLEQPAPPGELVDHSPSRYCYYLWQQALGGQRAGAQA